MYLEKSFTFDNKSSPKVIWEEPRHHPSRQRMNWSAACSSSPITQPPVRHIHTAVPHPSSLGLHYIALYDSSLPTKFSPLACDRHADTHMHTYTHRHDDSIYCTSITSHGRNKAYVSKLHEISARVTCGRCSTLLSRQCNTLCSLLLEYLSP